jgi:hypothetical protein
MLPPVTSAGSRAGGFIFIDIISIDNYAIKVVSKAKLLEMKRSISPAREKDKFDVHNLEKIIEKEAGKNENR